MQFALCSMARLMFYDCFLITQQLATITEISTTGVTSWFEIFFPEHHRKMCHVWPEVVSF